MDPLSIAAVALPAIGSMFGQSSANRTNLRIAREQMAFQERMSSTSWQRGMADMRAAGMNPMLAFMQGGGSSPGGASATMEDAVGPAVSSAMQAMRLKSDLQVLKQQALNLQADTQKKYTENQESLSRTGLNDSLKAKAQVEAALASAMLPAARISGSQAGGVLNLLGKIPILRRF